MRKEALLGIRQDVGQKQVGSQQRQTGPEAFGQAAKSPKTSWVQSYQCKQAHWQVGRCREKGCNRQFGEES